MKHTSIILTSEDYDLLWNAIKPVCRFSDEADGSPDRLIVMAEGQWAPGAPRIAFVRRTTIINFDAPSPAARLVIAENDEHRHESQESQ